MRRLLVIALFSSYVLFGATIPSLSDINTSVAEDDLLLIYDVNASYGDRNKKILFENLRHILLNTVANDSAYSAMNFAGTGYDRLFKYNKSDEMEILCNMRIGTKLYESDSGLITDGYMPITISSSKGDEHGIGDSIDGNIPTMSYAQADSFGGVQALGMLDIGMSLVTSDALWSTIQVMTLDDESVWSIQAEIIGKRELNSYASLFMFVGLFKHDGGTLSQIGSTADIIKPIESNPDTDARFLIENDDVLVQVKGIDAQNWYWQCVIKVKRMK
jgi:hypothetical protein